MQRLISAKNSKIILDANILMCGSEYCSSNAEYSFQTMRECYIDHIFSFFNNLLIHEAVMLEVGEERKQYLTQFLNRNLTVVFEENLYSQDPIYTDIFNAVARYDMFDYERKSLNLLENPSHNRGDVFTLAYAAYHGIPFCSSRDGAVISALRDLKELKNVSLVGFEYCLLLGYLINDKNPVIKKRIKSLYKTYCLPEIKKGFIPKNFGEFIESIK